MFQAVRKNFGLKLLAFALAVTAWAYFHFSAAPSITAHFDQQLSVPIVVTGVQPGLAAQVTDRTAIVTIEAPRNGPPIKADQIEAVLDLADRTTPGVMNVPLKIVAPDLSVKSYAPASITLMLDRLESRIVPLTISYSGANGALVVTSSSVDPATATVRGVTSQLAKVTTVRIDLPLGTKPGELDAMFRPIASDEAGRAVGDVTIAPNLVRVRARFAAARNSTGMQP